LGSLGGGSVAVGTALVAEKVGSGLLVGFGSEGVRGMDEKNKRAGSDEGWKQARKTKFKCGHRDYFLIDFWGVAPAWMNLQGGRTRR
jgi:hypothetical protein